MELTPFAGLTRLEPSDPLSTDNFSFQERNPAIIDSLLRLGAVAHRHDQHPALVHDPTPLDPVVATLDTGGTIPADLSISVGYTLLDADAGETPLNENVIVVTTQAPLVASDIPPTVAWETTAGGLLANTYVYAATVTDGAGGETELGPVATAVVPPGSGTNQVRVSGLDDIVTDAGGTGWRLWRRVGGGDWNLLASGSGAEVVDDGTLCPDCNETPPLDTGQTNATNRLHVTVPGGQPARAVNFRIYASTDGTFSNPALLGEYPIADAGTIKEYTSLTVLDGEPPVVSRAYPGAHKIDPDTEILEWFWKRPVDTVGDLPSAGNQDGDARIVIASHTIYIWTGAAWEENPNAASARWKDPVANVGALPGGGNTTGDVRLVLDIAEFRYWDGDSWEAAGGGGGGGGTPGHMIMDETNPLTQRARLNFEGAGVTATDDGPDDMTTVTIPGGGGGGGGHTIADEGSALADEPTLDFVGAGVTVTDDGGGSRTVVTIPGGSAAGRTVATVSTASIAADAEEDDLISMAVGYRILKLETNRPARVRIYATDAHRTADASRPVGTDPTGDHGLVLEFVTTGSDLVWTVTPLVDGANMEAVPDDNIPVAIQNLDTVTGIVTLDLTYVATE